MPPLEQIDTAVRAPLVIEPDGTPTIVLDPDLDDTEPESTANLVPIRDPQTTELETLPPLRTTQTVTIPARIKEWFVDGEGVLAVMLLAPVGVATLAVHSFVIWAQMMIALTVANLTMIIAILIGAALIPALMARGKGPAFITVKGCPNGPTPGSWTIKR